MLPRLNNGRIEVVRIIRLVDDRHRWVLRLWPTNMEISDNSAPVFEGTIEIQIRHHLADMIFIATDSGNYDLPLKSLEALLKGRFDVKWVNRRNDETILDIEDGKVDWHGEVLLIGQDKAAP